MTPESPEEFAQKMIALVLTVPAYSVKKAVAEAVEQRDFALTTSNHEAIGGTAV